LYCATKSAVRAVAEAMDEEIMPLGLRSLYIEPGYFRTNFLQEGNRGSYTSRIKDYETLVSQRYELLASFSGKQPGDPKKLAQLVIDYVRKEGAFKDVGNDYPGGLPVGSDAYNLVKQKLESQLALLARWKDVISSTDLPM
jgi:NAD(P)-dependent dehydrogenase (short-subunit alcohol dehydrogenase family)